MSFSDVGSEGTEGNPPSPNSWPDPGRGASRYPAGAAAGPGGANGFFVPAFTDCPAALRSRAPSRPRLRLCSRARLLGDGKRGGPRGEREGGWVLAVRRRLALPRRLRAPGALPFRSARPDRPFGAGGPGVPSAGACRRSRPRPLHPRALRSRQLADSGRVASWHALRLGSLVPRPAGVQPGRLVRTEKAQMPHGGLFAPQERRRGGEVERGGGAHGVASIPRRTCRAASLVRRKCSRASCRRCSGGRR